MRKSLLLVLALMSLSIFSCESDDESTAVNDTPVYEVEVPNSIIRVSMVNTSTNEVTLTNLGNTATNIGEYFFCLGPGTYRQISDLSEASTTIAPNETLTVVYNLIDAAGDGLSIFTSGVFSSSDPEILIDYVQWGAANQPRVNQAVEAGRWNDAGAFIETNTTYSFNGQAAQFGVSFWSGN